MSVPASWPPSLPANLPLTTDYGRKEEDTMPPVIDKTKCKKCMKCVETCSEDVYFGSKRKAFPQVTYPEECAYCNACVEECPESAVKLRIPLPMMLLYKTTA
jgi:adenylylsulfate reductase, subunit B